MCSSLFDWFLCRHYRLIFYQCDLHFNLYDCHSIKLWQSWKYPYRSLHFDRKMCSLKSSMQRQVKQLLHVPVVDSSYQLGKWILLMAYWQSSSLFFAWNTKPKPPLPKHSSCSKSDRYLCENTSNNYFIIILLFFHVDYNDTNNTGNNIIIFLRNRKCQD